MKICSLCLKWYVFTRMKIILLLLLFLLLTPVSFAAQKLCPTVIVYGAGDDIKFTETEKLLVCGDPKNPSYQHIPPYQASYFFKAFLQSRGYLSPTFQTEGDVLHIDTGRVTRLKRIKVISENAEEKKAVKKKLKRYYGNEVLNPNLLDSMKKRSKSVLGENGYPCANPEPMGVLDISQVDMTLNEGGKFKFGEVKKEKIDGLEDNALDRYYPYKAKNTFNEKLLQLNEKRLLRAEAMQGTYYLNNCSDKMEDLELSQFFILGPPRTVRFGVGASTEQGPMARFKWSNNRYKSMASVLSFTAQASFRNQSLNATSDMFFWKDQPRQSLYTQVELSRSSQIDYEQSALSIRPHMKWTMDWTRYFQMYTLGPTYEASSYFAKGTTNTKHYSSVNINGSTQLMSHTYEFFDIHPQEGSVFGMNFDFRHPALGFPEPLLMLSGTHSELKELGFWGKGSIIGAYRFNFGTTWVADDVELQSLPPSVKFYGGGSDDIRGFLLNTLPDNNGLGALTKLQLKLELRKTYLFIESLEAFGFLDNAFFGNKSWDIDPGLWYSPGAGLRWLSPIGMVQGFVARGYASRPFKDYGNYYYLGIGGTF